jgi:hypothetical protein
MKDVEVVELLDDTAHNIEVVKGIELPDDTTTPV